MEDTELKMDPETGEYYADIETGEISCEPLLDAETGECEDGAYSPLEKFKIPSCLYASSEENICSRQIYKPLKANQQELELITAVIYLLPTMICFSKILWTFALLLEIVLHNWAHKKNKNLKTNAIYYKSPLHVMVKEFCGRCKEENSKEKISKIQDLRKDKQKKYELEYIRRVVT